MLEKQRRRASSGNHWGGSSVAAPTISLPLFSYKYKTFYKKKNVFVHTTKCLKAKNHIMFFIHQKNNVLACILTLITSLLKSREHWPKLQKKKIILFVF
jgi:hypothetical protein